MCVCVSAYDAVSLVNYLCSFYSRGWFSFYLFACGVHIALMYKICILIVVCGAAKKKNSIFSFVLHISVWLISRNYCAVWSVLHMHCGTIQHFTNQFRNRVPDNAQHLFVCLWYVGCVYLCHTNASRVQRREKKYIYKNDILMSLAF